MSTFGQNLKELRISRGYTQQQLADAVGVNIRTVQKWESGENHPKTTEGDTFKLYQKLASVLDVRIIYDPTDMDLSFIASKGATEFPLEHSTAAISQSKKRYDEGYEDGRKDALDKIVAFYTKLLETE